MIWQDIIIGNSPLEHTTELVDLRGCLSQQGLHSLAEISIWDSHGNWEDWIFHNLPAHLLHQKHILLDKLKGLAPTKFCALDLWKWGNIGVYATVLGYAALQLIQNQVLNPSIWQCTLDTYGIPKVNFFTWLLIHRKVLMGKSSSQRNYRATLVQPLQIDF